MNPLRSLVPTLTLCLAIALVAAPAALADPSGLVAAYGFEEASGTTATDSSGSANTGTLAGPARSASGRFGAALSFDGVNDLVNVADLASLDLTVGMTLEAWVRPGGGGWRTALLKERPGGLAYALYSSSDTNRPMAEIAASSGGETRGTAGLPASTWSHLASTYDGATLRLYVNGTQVSSRAVSGAIALSSGALRIGGNTIWGEYFNGLIDEVRVYNRALTAGEVQLDMGRAVVSASSDTQPPTAPTGLTATVSSDDVHLAWGAAADNVGVTAYRVYRDGSLVTTLGPAATSYDDLDRAPGTYRYTVVAVDGIGLAGPASNEATATIAAPDTVGPTAATLTATLDGNDVHLAWTESTDPSGVKEYRIYRNGTLHRTLPAAERSFDDLDVPSGTRRYSVRAVDNAGNQGPYSNEETVIVPDADAEPPTAPALTAMVTSDDIHLSWTASTDDLGVKEYRLYRDGALISTRTSRDFDDNNRAEGTYRYKVVAVDNAGHTSPDSNEAEATVGPDTPPPTIALASNCDGATVHDYISLRPTFSDDRGPVTVTIKVDGQTIRGPENMGTSGSFFFDWETRGLANGPHLMTAVARDGAGNEAVDECDWIVHNPLVTLPFTSHADGDTVSGTQTFKVQVLGDGDPISRDAMVVRFEATGPVTVGDSSPVYDKEWAWDTTKVPNGLYTVKATVSWMGYFTPHATSTIQVHVENTAPTPPSGLVAAYGFEHTGGTTATDSSPTGAAGTIAGATSVAGGKFGRALSFDGANDMVTVADSNPLDLAPGMTLEAWVKPTTVNDWRTVLLKERPGSLAYALYAAADNGRPMTEISVSGQREARGTAALPAGAWSHLAATYDGSIVRLYVNGTQVASTAATGGLVNSTGALRIGGNAVWGEWFSGLIDEVRVYERALSAAEIQADNDQPVVPGT